MNKEKIIEAIKELEKLQNVAKTHPFEVGKKYFIRAVTYHCILEVQEIVGNFLISDNIVWVADSGRFQQAIENGEMNEVEPIRGIQGGVCINTIVDFWEWNHNIPSLQK